MLACVPIRAVADWRVAGAVLLLFASFCEFFEKAMIRSQSMRASQKGYERRRIAQCIVYDYYRVERVMIIHASSARLGGVMFCVMCEREERRRGQHSVLDARRASACLLSLSSLGEACACACLCCVDSGVVWSRSKCPVLSACG